SVRITFRFRSCKQCSPPQAIFHSQFTFLPRTTSFHFLTVPNPMNLFTSSSLNLIDKPDFVEYDISSMGELLERLTTSKRTKRVKRYVMLVCCLFIFFNVL